MAPLVSQTRREQARRGRRLSAEGMLRGGSPLRADRRDRSPLRSRPTRFGRRSTRRSAARRRKGGDDPLQSERATATSTWPPTTPSLLGSSRTSSCRRSRSTGRWPGSRGCRRSGRRRRDERRRAGGVREGLEVAARRAARADRVPMPSTREASRRREPGWLSIPKRAPVPRGLHGYPRPGTPLTPSLPDRAPSW